MISYLLKIQCMYARAFICFLSSIVPARRLRGFSEQVPLILKYFEGDQKLQ